jgi:anaerobic selenocysteine-containing dehydrogenase
VNTDLSLADTEPAAELTSESAPAPELTANESLHLRTCPLCEAMCGIEIQVKNERVTRIRPNPNDVWSKGHICPKGTVLGKLHDDPDRLRSPMVREGTEWRAVSWDEALTRCEELIHGVLERHGKGALAVRTGNMVGRSYQLARYVGAFSMSARITRYGSSVVDQQPKNLACALMYGDPWMIPVPDIARTQYFLVMGANPHASQGSILAFPDVMGEIERIRERDGKTVVIDPVNTGTAQRADEWIPIVPGSDTAFLLALVHTLFADGLVQLGALEGIVNGVDEVRALTNEWTPERASLLCGISPETIRRIAHEISAAESAAIYGRIGLCTQEFGTLASWLTDVVAILTGNFDRPGTLMFPTLLAPFMSLMPARKPTIGTWKTRVRGTPEVLGEVPASCFAEEMDTPGVGQIRGVITIGCNPVSSAPDSNRLDAAMADLECMISVDNYINHTTRHAQVILPGGSPLEHPNFDIWSWAFALRSGSKWADPLFPLPDGWVQEWELMHRLGAFCNGQKNADIDLHALDAAYFSFFCTSQGLDPATIMEISPDPGPERLCDLAVRMGPWGDRYGANPGGLTLADVKAEPNGIDRGAAVPRLPGVLTTDSGHIELAPEYIISDLPRFEEFEKRARPELVLVSRRNVRSLNSWMHNVEVLLKGKDRSCLQIHPTDAALRNLLDGDLAVVSSTSGSVTIAVDVSTDIAPGVVSLPHGWGNNGEGMQLSVGARYPGINTNILSPGDLLDEISNNAVLNGIPVTVAKSPA